MFMKNLQQDHVSVYQNLMGSFDLIIGFYFVFNLNMEMALEFQRVNNSNFPSKNAREAYTDVAIQSSDPSAYYTTKIDQKGKANDEDYAMLSNNSEDDPLFKILSWRDGLNNQQAPPADSFRTRKVQSIVADDQQQWGQNFQGILIDVDWGTISFQQFKQLQLGDKLISNGIAFVWGASHNIQQLFDYFSDQGFQYVENFMFVMLDRKKIPAKKKTINNKNSLLNYFKKTATKEQQEINEEYKSNKDYQMDRVDYVQQIFMEREGEYFKQTQRVLYMFRKHHKTEALELRHQRTSDAFFTIGDTWELDWKSMQAVYKMIQTLLIKANYQKNKPLRLLQLWGNPQRPRKGWVTICQQKFENRNAQEQNGLTIKL